MNSMKKLLLVVTFVMMSAPVKSFYYMNDQSISIRSILTGCYCTSVDYNIVNAGDGSIGGFKRLFGVHDMSISVPGYEPVYLVQEDVCLHPNLFTMLWFFGKNSWIAQRYACVKWWLPLSFSFNVQDDTLTIQSSIWKYRFLAPFRATATIPLVKTLQKDSPIKQLDKDLSITVSVNGRTIVVGQRTIVQIYSSSALTAAIIPHFLWPML